MLVFIHPNLYVAPTSNKGLGVFSKMELAAGTVIEVAPVIVMHPKDRKHIHQTVLHDYYFSWGEDQLSAGIALGFGSLYNHSSEPNCEFEADFATNRIKFRVNRIIYADEEISINYNMSKQVKAKLWFEEL